MQMKETSMKEEEKEQIDKLMKLLDRIEALKKF